MAALTRYQEQQLFSINVDSPVGALKTQLSKLLMSVDRIGWNTGHTSGRFDVRRTSRMLAGSERVFKQRVETEAVTTAVSIVIDLSSSMSEKTRFDSKAERIDLASQCAYAIATAVERSNCQVEVIGFATAGGGKVFAPVAEMNDMQGNKGKADNAGLYRGAKLINIKPFDRRVGVMRRVFEKMRLIVGGGTPDYHAVRTVVERMSLRTEHRKLVLVLTDGAGEMDLMRRFTDSCEKLYGVPTLAIGIADPYAVKASYNKSVYVRDIADLSTTAIRELIKLVESKV